MDGIEFGLLMNALGEPWPLPGGLAPELAPPLGHREHAGDVLAPAAAPDDCSGLLERRGRDEIQPAAGDAPDSSGSPPVDSQCAGFPLVVRQCQ